MKIEVIRAAETWEQAGEFDMHDTPDTKYIVLTDDDFPVATCRFYRIDSESAMIGRVVVLPEYRGNGLGKQVVKEAENWLCELGYKKAVVESRDVAVAFYEKLGYAVSDQNLIHGDTFDCFRMERLL